MPPSNRQGMIRFGVVGAINTIVDLGVFAALYRIAEMEPLIANGIAFAVAVSNSYLLNHYWTFQKKQHLSFYAYIRFVILNTGGLVLGTMAIILLGKYMPLEMAKVIATAITFLWNYNTSKRFVFNGKHHE